jgi:hypothetical protein
MVIHSPAVWLFVKGLKSYTGSFFIKLSLVRGEEAWKGNQRPKEMPEGKNIGKGGPFLKGPP